LIERITSQNNTAVKEFIKLLDNRKYRLEQGFSTVEGKRIIEDCYNNDVAIRCVFIEEGKQEKFNNFINSLSEIGIKVYIISENINSKLSTTKNSQGIYAIIKQRDNLGAIDAEKFIDNEENFLILSKINDPNNMGVIIRSAVAFGFTNIIVDSFCVDVYNPKVIRGTMGNIFKVNLFVLDDTKEFINNINNKNYTTIATTLGGNSKNLGSCKINEPLAIIIGNEANGLDSDIMDISNEKVMIPMNKTVESLNVATATSILMWEVFKNSYKGDSMYG